MGLLDWFRRLLGRRGRHPASPASLGPSEVARRVTYPVEVPGAVRLGTAGSVRLSFADGREVFLEPADPLAEEFQRIAEVMVDRDTRS